MNAMRYDGMYRRSEQRSVPNMLNMQGMFLLISYISGIHFECKYLTYIYVS